MRIEITDSPHTSTTLCMHCHHEIKRKDGEWYHTGNLKYTQGYPSNCVNPEPEEEQG